MFSTLVTNKTKNKVVKEVDEVKVDIRGPRGSPDLFMEVIEEKDKIGSEKNVDKDSLEIKKPTKIINIVKNPQEIINRDKIVGDKKSPTIINVGKKPIVPSAEPEIIYLDWLVSNILNQSLFLPSTYSHYIFEW